MKKLSLRQLAVPAFLVIYFGIAAVPIISSRVQGEVFPFFSFKLFSQVHSNYARYDVLFNAGTDDAFFLLYENERLPRLQRWRYQQRLLQVQKDFLESERLNTASLDDLLVYGKTAVLVEMTGSYVGTSYEGEYDMHIVKTLKE